MLMYNYYTGNHEIREVQETFSYKEECLEKFGATLGAEVWEATNKAFDCMPIAAVINHKVQSQTYVARTPYYTQSGFYPVWGNPPQSYKDTYRIP